MRRMTFTPALALLLGLTLSIGACGDDDATPTDNGDATETTDDTTEPTGDDDATEPTGDDDAGPSDDDTTEPGDDDVVEPPASTFCDDYVATCGDWPVAETSCADWWAAAAEGTEGDSTGATQACYTYHLDVAASMTEQADIDMHCAHALGMADMNDFAPCTAE